MSPFQDHLIASVAAVGVLLTTVNLQHQRATEVIHQSRLQGGQTALHAWADVVAQDIRSIGSGVPTGSAMLLSSDASTLSFRGTADSTGTARAIAYAWTTELDASGSSVVRVRRTVDGVPSGQSPALAAFDLELRDASGAEAGALADTRRVHVRAELALGADPTVEDATVRRVGWETEFAPSNLSRTNTGASSHPLLSASVTLTSLGS